MTSWTTILRDLALTAIRAAGRATTSARSPRGSARIDIPDLATVHEARQGQRERAGGANDLHDDQPDDPGPDEVARHAGASDADPDRDRRRRDHDDGVATAGQVGPAATVEVDPRDLDLVQTSYNPVTDGDPDPGEIVWTWVPYQEADGRGKDRPVVVVARLSDDAVLAVPLSSRDHDGDRGWVGIGAGDWDGEHRSSWVNLDRILRIHPDGMRREAAILDHDRFARMSAALASHHHWPS